MNFIEDMEFIKLEQKSKKEVLEVKNILLNMTHQN